MNETTMQDFIQGNRDANKNYFDRSTMRFFDSRVHKETWNGDGYFVTSEQFHGSNGYAASRKYSIRKGNLETFNVETVGGFQAFDTLREAKAALRRKRMAQSVCQTA